MSMRLSKHCQETSTIQFPVVYLTIEDVMERLQVSRPTVYKYFRWGLPRYKVGKSVRVSPADLEKWLSVHQCIAHVQSFYSQKLGEGLSPGTVRNLHLVLHSAMENAVKWNLVSRNVVALVTRPSKGSYEAQVLTVEQARTLIETAKHHKVWPLLVVASLQVCGVVNCWPCVGRMLIFKGESCLCAVQ